MECESLVKEVHRTPSRMVLALSGGGSQAVAELLTVPGASRTVLEAVVPYGEAALLDWLGGRPEQSCDPRTARAMAVVGFDRARRQAKEEGALMGIGCTAALATDRPRRGEHRAHVAIQTEGETVCWSLHLAKGRRSRRDEEELVARLVLNATAETCGIVPRLPLTLEADESVECRRATGEPAWRELLLGDRQVAAENGAVKTPSVVLSGAFDPLHAGHRRMAEVAEQLLGRRVHFELSIVNADKPPLDYQELQRRLDQFTADEPVLLTRAATFEAKSALFRGATFAVGVDTLRRIATPTYYGDDPAARLAALESIAERGCRFLVFGRDMGTGFVRLSDLDLPKTLQAICQEVPADIFREDISSTALRRAERENREQ